jgi:hypothetical protein
MFNDGVGDKVMDKTVVNDIRDIRDNNLIIRAERDRRDMITLLKITEEGVIIRGEEVGVIRVKTMNIKEILHKD